MVHSQKKFPSSNDSNFNILAISLDIISDLDEWYLYMYGENGVFTNKSFVSQEYSNVDAILLTTPVAGHIRWEVYKYINVWHLEETINILLLDPKKEDSETGKYYFNTGMEIYGGTTKQFLVFLQKLQFESDKELGNLDNDEEKNLKYVESRIIKLRMVTEFMEYLKNMQ